MDAAELARYSRHLSLPEVGLEGQQRLRHARVLLIGAGGLGCPVGMYLAAAGVGTLSIVDHDVVEISNLQRQIGHAESDLGHSKAESLTKTLQSLNPHVQIQTHPVKFIPSNALQLAAEHDVVVDCSDNFKTRYLANDAAYFAQKPLVSASVYRFQGQLSVFWPHQEGPCYRCLYPVTLPPSQAPT